MRVQSRVSADDVPSTALLVLLLRQSGQQSCKLSLCSHSPPVPPAGARNMPVHNLGGLRDLRCKGVPSDTSPHSLRLRAEEPVPLPCDTTALPARSSVRPHGPFHIGSQEAFE